MIKKIINFYIYSSLHIAFCAVCLAIFTYKVYKLPVDYHYLAFLGTGTLITYSLHKLIGIKRSKSFLNMGRFAVAQLYQSHILLYTILSFIACFIIFWGFETDRKLMLFILSSISLLYVLPILKKGKRLRDLAYIKIILVGLVWSGSTVTIILIESGIETAIIISHSLIQFLFIIGITIPFDLRDLNVDMETGVKTLATSLSLKSAKTLTFIILASSALFSWITLNLPNGGLWAITGTLLIATSIISISWNKQNDYWFSGLLDGTMMLPSIFLFLLDSFFFT